MMQITDEQREKLEALWDIYGNEGEKYTIGNHKLIQKVLFDEEAEFDAILSYYSEIFGGGSGGGPFKDITEECLTQVKAVLGLS